MTYSCDFRALALRKFYEKLSYRRAARSLAISQSTLHAWVKQGQNAADAWRKGKRKQKTARNRLRSPPEVAHFLASSAIQLRVTSLQQLQILLFKHTGHALSRKTIGRLLRRQGVTRKRTAKRMRGTGADNRGAVTAGFCRQYLEALQRGSLVVSIDECYFSERVLPLYGYSRAGQKCVVAAPVGSWSKTSLLLAIASDGSAFYELFHGSVNRATFTAFLDSLPFPEGTTLVMDNVGFHKRTEHVTDAKGFRVLFTPPYSPQFNPVEMAFSVAKTAFRSAWPWPEGVDRAIDDALSLRAAHIQRFFAHVSQEAEKQLGTV